MKMNIMETALMNAGVESTKDMEVRLKDLVKKRNSALSMALTRRNPDGSFRPVKTYRQRAAEIAREERILRRKLSAAKKSRS